MRVAVTGAAGYVGGRLVETLTAPYRMVGKPARSGAPGKKS